MRLSSLIPAFHAGCALEESKISWLLSPTIGIVCAGVTVWAQGSTAAARRPWSVISRSSNHRILASLLEANGFDQQLNRTGLTVFAPTDKVCLMHILRPPWLDCNEVQELLRLEVYLGVT
jgi:hypothetical protein